MLSAQSHGCIFILRETDDKNMKVWRHHGFVFLFQFQIAVCKKGDSLNLHIVLLCLNVDSGLILVVAISITRSEIENKTI